MKSIFGIREVPKIWLFDIFEPLKFDFEDFLQFLRAKNWPKAEFRASESAKKAILERLES